MIANANLTEVVVVCVFMTSVCSRNYFGADGTAATLFDINGVLCLSCSYCALAPEIRLKRMHVGFPDSRGTKCVRVQVEQKTP